MKKKRFFQALVAVSREGYGSANAIDGATLNPNRHPSFRFVRSAWMYKKKNKIIIKKTIITISKSIKLTCAQNSYLLTKIVYSFVIGLVRFIYYFVPKSNWTTRCATIESACVLRSVKFYSCCLIVLFSFFWSDSKSKFQIERDGTSGGSERSYYYIMPSKITQKKRRK